MRNLKLPSKKEINFIFHSFSKKERTLFLGFVILLCISTLLILQNINKSFIVSIPQKGGSLTLGIAGSPRFVNPIIANGEADEDIIALVYSGLMRKNIDGNLIPDLAQSYEGSENGLTYTFTLKDDIYFHDGKPVTVDDILFTINTIKDSIIESPQKINWEGVNVQKIDEKNIKFTLKQPFTAFLENTTIGILPSHLWKDTPIELNTANTNPIGSGPYMISEVNKQESGIIDSFKLTSFKKFSLGEPYIKNINLYFYKNEDELIKALNDNQIDQISGITPTNAEILKEKGYHIESSVLGRVFGLFFNQNQNQLFVDKTIIKAINQLIDKEKIVKEVLLGYGTVIDSPIPPNIAKYSQAKNALAITRKETLEKVQEDLSKAGWKKGTDGILEKTTKEKNKTKTTKLEFSISTGNLPELAKTAELIQKDLVEVGMKVEVKTFETGNLNQNVIRPRKYDTLLFGEIINHESDLFAFWHSSQRKDPGLNVAMYTNTKVDKILEDAFIILEEEARIKKYTQFEDEIKKDMPTVFLYSPKLIYVVSKELKNFDVKNLISPVDRYLNSYLWYIKTEDVWKIFAK